MKKQMHQLLGILLLTFHIGLAEGFAQPLLPPEGLKAEMAEDWGKAVEVYRDILKQEPRRVDLWLRIADIEAHVGNYDEAAAALMEAAQLAPNEADIHFRLSQACSVANQPDLALAAIERAVELEPDNTRYLKASAQLANWAGKYEVAADSYERILSFSPDDDSALLNLARSSSWSGRLDTATSAYRRYLEMHPEEKDVYVEYAKAEAWRGNYHASLSILERYRREFGESRNYLGEKAGVLAWARRPTEAMDLILPLLEDEPDDYELNYSRTIALHYANKPSDAVESLDKLFQLRPDSKETEDIRRFVMTPLRPDVTSAFSFYTDKDDLDRYHSANTSGYSVSPETRLEGAVETDYLHADEGEGLERIDGGENARHYQARVGVNHRFSQKVAMDYCLGVADAEDKTRLTYGIGLDYQPQDNLDLRLERDYGFYLISPRTVDLGIRRGANRFQLQWEPDLRHVAILDLGYNTFTDDNEQWEVILSPRRSVLRSEKLNLDAGLRGWWFGFDDDLAHGYYDPSSYQSYMATGFGYWKMSDNDGISIALDLGVLKDNDMDNFRFGWGSSAEGTFGLYRDMMLKVGGGVTHNVRQAGGAFRAYEAHILLDYRF